MASLPRPRSPLPGRERELTQAEDLLRRADVGVVWVPLALVSAADQVLPAIARAAGGRGDLRPAQRVAPSAPGGFPAHTPRRQARQ